MTNEAKLIAALESIAWNATNEFPENVARQALIDTDNWKHEDSEESLSYQVATKIMDYKPDGYGWFADGLFIEIFDPEDDHNHMAKVEQKILEDGRSEQAKEYLAAFDSKAHYMSATLEEKCLAALNAYSDHEGTE